MPLKIRGSLIMLTALILIGNPSCEEKEKLRLQQSVPNVVNGFCAYMYMYSLVMTKLSQYFVIISSHLLLSDYIKLNIKSQFEEMLLSFIQDWDFTWRMLTTFLARNGPGLDACDMPTPV